MSKACRIATTTRAALAVEEALRALETDHKCSLRVGEVARLVGLSDSRLRHVFKGAVGASLVQHRNVLRMQRSRDLLETTRLSVKEITAMVGMNDVSHFIRTYKKVFGITPQSHRYSIKLQVLRRAGGSSEPALGNRANRPDTLPSAGPGWGGTCFVT